MYSSHFHVSSLIIIKLQHNQSTCSSLLTFSSRALSRTSLHALGLVPSLGLFKMWKHNFWMKKVTKEKIKSCTTSHFEELPQEKWELWNENAKIMYLFSKLTVQQEHTCCLLLQTLWFCVKTRSNNFTFLQQQLLKRTCYKINLILFILNNQV